MTTAAADRERCTLARALALLIAATAVVVATEFIVVGLLPVLARDLDVSLAEAGWLVAAFAVSAAVLGPPLTLAAATLPARHVLTAALLLFAATNIAAIVVPAYPTMMAARIVQGAMLPVFISVGTASVTALAAPDRRGRTLALANTGFVLGLVVAMPAGVALAEAGTWQPSFFALALFAIVAAMLMVACFPGHRTPLPIGEQAALLRRPLFLCHLVLSVAVFSAMFAPYTYLAAWLEDAVGLDMQGTALTLAGFSAAGLAGNAAIARQADRAPLAITASAMGVLVVAALAASLMPDRPWLLVPLLGLWGAVHTVCVTLCQVRVTLAGDGAVAFAMAMNIACANLGIALGALAGGLVVERWGVGSIGAAAAMLAPAVAALAWLTVRLEQRRATA